MARGRVDFEVITGEEFQRVGRALREVDAELPGKLRKDLRVAARPLVAMVKEKVRSLPTHGRVHTGLRRRVAAGVGMRVSLKNGITITTSMQRPSEAIIPRGMDSREGWRHPVFGNTDNWVQQRTGGSWFREPLASRHDEIEDAVRHTLEEARDRIDRAGGHL